ncbi:MAG: hypothetical protein HC796_11670, partial [Synechococcaceae cyanobacterium RL_1_2]|nr:hypothetical protein [Synechococcaceae cyanobacterium RL_1_2]
ATNLAADPALCGATTDDSGYADALRDVLSAPATGTTTVFSNKTIVNKNYKMRTIFEPTPNAPFDVLAVTYEVWFDENKDDVIDESADLDEKIIAQFYTEIIPKAALGCAIQ